MNFMEFAIKVQQIAKIGLLYSKDPYAIDNYEQLQQLSNEVLNTMVTPPIIKNIFERDIYPTPSSSVRVIVLNEKDELLMVKESDDGWAVPGGWCEIYLDLKDNAKKEVQEEAGIDVSIDRLLGIFRREVYKDYPSIVSEYVHYFSAKPIGGTLHHNHETLDVRYFSLNNLPELSRKNSRKELTLALDAYFGRIELHVD